MGINYININGKIKAFSVKPDEHEQLLPLGMALEIFFPGPAPQWWASGPGQRVEGRWPRVCSMKQTPVATDYFSASERKIIIWSLKFAIFPTAIPRIFVY